MPSDLGRSRLVLDFGLRAADLFFRELVVPGIGRVWFARQLSWPAAAIRLHSILRTERGRSITPTTIAHGIEALGCKLAFEHDDSDEPSGRIIGTRAFARSPDTLDFRSLRLSSQYVINTHRQVSTRALRQNDGLGFATGSTFNSLVLERIGEELADAFLGQSAGRGGITLRNWLIGWLSGERLPSEKPDALRSALSPETPSAGEKEIIRGRLMNTSGPAAETRRHLAASMGRRNSKLDIEGRLIPNLQRAGRLEQAAHIALARSFGLMLDRARDVVAAITLEVQTSREGVRIVDLFVDAETKHRVLELKRSSNMFLEKLKKTPVPETSAAVFASSLDASDEPGAIRQLVASCPLLLNYAGTRVIRGPRFRTILTTREEAFAGFVRGDSLRTAPEADFGDRTFRIENFHELLIDTSNFRI